MMMMMMMMHLRRGHDAISQDEQRTLIILQLVGSMMVQW